MRCNKIRAIIIISVLFSIITNIYAENNHSDILKIVEKMEKLYRSNSSYAEMEMQIITPHWERTLSLKAWSQGTDKMFILIVSPQKEEGTATLRIGNEMWNYLPKTNKVMKIPPSMMSSSWMGSDFTNDDLVKEISLTKDYEFSDVTPSEMKDSLIYIEFIPKQDVPIVWAKIITIVRKDDGASW